MEVTWLMQLINGIMLIIYLVLPISYNSQLIMHFKKLMFILNELNVWYTFLQALLNRVNALMMHKKNVNGIIIQLHKIFLIVLLMIILMIMIIVQINHQC